MEFKCLILDHCSVPSDEGMIFGIDAEEERNMDNESIDSNDENYYANDYPDFDDDSEMERYNDDDDDEDYENDDIERICRNAYRREMVRRQVEMLTNAVANFILSKYPDIKSIFKCRKILSRLYID